MFFVSQATSTNKTLGLALLCDSVLTGKDTVLWGILVCGCLSGFQVRNTNAVYFHVLLKLFLELS